MQNKLQELTDKLYKEGLSKGTAEAAQIVADAKAEAKDIVDKAKKEAEEIIAAAKSSSAEIAKNSDSELKMASRQAIITVKQEIEEMITATAISPSISGAFSNPEFIQSIVKEAISKFNPNDEAANTLEVMLPQDKQAELDKYFSGKVGEALGVFVDVKFSKGIKGGFKIAPKNGGYMISFTEQDFDNLFKAYLRPRLVELLFGGK